MVGVDTVSGVCCRCSTFCPAHCSVPAVDVAICSAQAAEHAVAGLAEQQLLVRMGAALGDDLPPLPGHEVPQLVDEEGGRQGLDTASRDGDQVSTHWTSAQHNTQFRHGPAFCSYMAKKGRYNEDTDWPLIHCSCPTLYCQYVKCQVVSRNILQELKIFLSFET